MIINNYNDPCRYALQRTYINIYSIKQITYKCILYIYNFINKSFNFIIYGIMLILCICV